MELHGESIGTNWYGSKLFNLNQHLKQGQNELVIRYTPTLNDKMNEPDASGLIGPVRLLKAD